MTGRQRKRLVRKMVIVIVLIWTTLIIYMISNGEELYDYNIRQHHIRTPHTDGYNRAKQLQEQCIMRGHGYNADTVRLVLKYSTTDGALQLCPIWKAGTTFLKRLFMMKTLKQYKNINNPYNISFLEQFDGEYGNVYNGEGTKRFLFVRNPYDRLLSGYVDKLLAPNPVYWKLIGIPAIKHARADPSQKSLLCGHDLTFKEYIKYVIYALGTGSASRYHRKSRRRVGVGHDLHFATLTEVSKPCHIKYDFVGKMETFSLDSTELIRQLNLSVTEHILTLNGSEMAADDAILDTTYQPYHTEFRSDMLKCITPLEALNRSWQKLQIRGLIGSQDLDIKDQNIEELSYSDFLHMARNARHVSTKEVRQQLKKIHFNQFYASIPIDMLHNLTAVYKDDFELFDYNAKPNQLFHTA